MMHDEIVTYEVAKLAKEKGFPQDPNENNLCDIYCWDNLRKIHSLCISAMWYTGEYSREDMYAAPTQSLLQRWLREEKNIHIEIIATASGYYWCVNKTNGTSITDSDVLDRGTNEGGCFDTYELALEDALKYALENLV